MKKYQCVKKDDLKDCGVCSLLSIIRYYGGDISREYLRELTYTTKNGTNAYFLMKAANEVGFSSKTVKGEITKLDKNLLPCIAHVIINNSYQHFVVIYDINIKKKKIVMADPAVGIRTIPLEEYNSISTDHFILLIPNKPIPKLNCTKNILGYLCNFLLHYKKLLLSIFFCSLIYTISNIILSYHFQFIIEGAINLKSINNLYFVSVIILLVVMLKVLMDFFRNKLLNIINHKLDYNLVKDVFNHIISLPYLYYKNRTTGEITSRINDISEVKDALSQVIITLLVDFILVLFVIIQLFKINIYLTVILLIMTFIYFIQLIVFNPILNRKIEYNYRKSSNLNSFMIESISAVDTIKNNCLEDKIKNDFDIKYSKLLINNYRLNNIYNLSELIKEFIYYIVIILIILIGSLEVINNKLTLVQLITYNSLIMYYLEPIRSMFNIDLTIKKVRNAISRASELMNVAEEDLSLDNKFCYKELKGNIKINNLTYSYNDKIRLLNNLNININQGQKVLIYGKSGEGKSTLAKILMGYLKISNETVYVDNKDINNYNILNLRQNICYISQNEILFNDSVYNNIILNNEIDYDKFLDICNMTLVNQIVKDNLLLYDTLLEENGFNISGGERQRIILARGLVRNSSIYILDESLSQIDVKKERIILKNIFDKLRDKTIIVISHRFNNNDLFDQKIDITGGQAYD